MLRLIYFVLRASAYFYTGQEDDGLMIPQLLTRIRQVVYGGPVKRAFQTVGIEGLVSDIYWPVFLALSDDFRTACVDEVCADFYVTDRIEYMRIVEGGIAEGDVLRDILRNVESDSVFFDIGANIGTFSCIVGTKLEEGRVAAFEPHPENVARLKENVELNGISADIFRYALGDTIETTSLSLDPDVSDVGAPKHSLATESGGESIEVSKSTGDALIREHDLPTPNVVKIDVEGAEFGVIRGLEDTLESIDYIYCEIHTEKMSDFGDSPGELHEFLEERGFSISTLSDRPPQYFIKAENTS